jgi:DNA (cytosine-5)-methyltransferase 1
MKTIKVGSDFSGVGAFNQALMRLGINYQEVFACDMDKYARQTFIENYGEPEYYPTNVYEREIPSESLDIYASSPPCQAFSLAGKRLGKEDKRGILFFNSLEFIQVNKPRYFIFENVKGLLSDDNGKTFNEWVNLLGGKSVNGLPVLFPYEESVPYHLYWKVLNAKDHGVPQNRERVFLIGIRDDKDNTFRFPIEEHLTKRLKDVLEDSVDDKYFLSKKMLESLTFESKGNYEIANTNKGGQKGIIQSENGEAISCLSATDYKQPKQILIHSATAKGYEQATEGDSIALAHPGSNTRPGRVGHGVAQTIDTSSTQGVISYTRDSKGNVVNRHIKQEANTIHTATGGGGNTDQFVIYNDKRLNETIAKNELPKGEPKAIDTYNKKVQDNAPTLTEPHHNTTRLWDGFKIRRLTPRECFRLMDFPDSFTWTVSDSQAYKQAGNSIVVRVLEKIINNLPI